MTDIFKKYLIAIYIANHQ